MASQIVLHCGAKPVTRQELALIEPPPATETWVPVKHSLVLQLVVEFLTQAGFSIEKEQLGLARNGHRFFGTLDLRSDLAPGIVLAVGVRNSTDMSFPLGFCAGGRTLVCDNLAFSSDLVVKRKHTKYGQHRFSEAICLAVQDLRQFQAAETQRIAYLQETILQPYEAEAFLLSAFERGLLSARSLPKAIEAFRRPAFDWGPTDRVWHLYNAMNFPLQPLAVSNPQRFSLATMQLMALLGPQSDLAVPADFVLDPSEGEPPSPTEWDDEPTEGDSADAVADE